MPLITLQGTFSEWTRRARLEKRKANPSQAKIKYCLQRAYFDSDDLAESFFNYSCDVAGRKKDGLVKDRRYDFALFMQKPGRYKMVQASRGSWKSSLCIVDYATWSIARDFFLNHESRERILLASEVNDLARRNARWIMMQMQKSEYKYLSGDHRDRGRLNTLPWGVHEMISKFRSDPTIGDPTIMPMGSTTERTGFHFDKILCDDLEAQRSSATRDMIENIWDFYRLLHSILDPKGQMIIACTRWHEDDIYRRIEKENEHLSEDEQFQIITIPACNDDFTGLNFPNVINEKQLRSIKKKQGSLIFSCTPAETPILMADWSFKPISQVVPGDRVVGFEKTKKHSNKRPSIPKKLGDMNGRWGSCNEMHLVETTVLETNSRSAFVQIMTMESGKKVRCTPDHNWWTGRNPGKGLERHRKSYRSATVGMKLTKVTEQVLEKTDEQVISDWGYLAGIIDGEGSVFPGNSVFIHQSLKHNPLICKKIREVLARLNIPYTDGPTGDQLWLTGGAKTKERILRNCPSIKSKRVLPDLFRKNFTLDKDKVLHIELDGYENVYALTTGTGNYIADTYASKNCQYMLNPMPDDARVFKAEHIKVWTPQMLNQARLHVYTTADFAFTEVKKSDFKRGTAKYDYTVIITVAIDEQWNYIVLDWFREKCSPHTGITELYRQWEQHKAMLSIVQKYDVRGVGESIDQVGFELGKQMPIDFVAYPPAGGKEGRIRELVQPRFEDKKVYLHPTMVKWFAEEEMLDFPKAKYDDCLDAICNVIRFGKPPPRVRIMSQLTKEQKEIELLKAGVDPSEREDDWMYV